MLDGTVEMIGLKKTVMPILSLLTLSAPYHTHFPLDSESPTECHRYSETEMERQKSTFRSSVSADPDSRG